MSERVWVAGVGNWVDCHGRLRFDPVIFDDCNRALAYIEFCKDYDRSVNKTRKFKLQSYVLHGPFGTDRITHPELN